MKIDFQDPNVGTDVQCRLRDAAEDVQRIAESQGIDTSKFSVEIRLYDDVINERKAGKIFGAGITGDSDFVLAVDPNEIYDPKVIDTFTSLGVHEINHLERMRLLGADPETLAEVLVSEGFAQVAEAEAGYRPASLSIESPLNMPSFEKEVASSLNDKILGDNKGDKGFDDWFVDSVGYDLGFNIVSGYLSDTGQTLDTALKVPAAEVIQHWQSKKDGHTL